VNKPNKKQKDNPESYPFVLVLFYTDMLNQMWYPETETEHSLRLFRAQGTARNLRSPVFRLFEVGTASQKAKICQTEPT